MENFCKGLVFGMLAGCAVGSIVVAKNKKLSKKLNEGLTTAEGKIKEVKENLEEKLSENSACDCPDNPSGSKGNCECNYTETENYSKNNFSKKNKND